MSRYEYDRVYFVCCPQAVPLQIGFDAKKAKMDYQMGKEIGKTSLWTNIIMD